MKFSKVKALFQNMNTRKVGKKAALCSLAVLLAASAVGVGTLQAGAAQETKTRTETVQEETTGENPEDQDENLLDQVIKVQTDSKTSETDKEETVYVVADADGSTQDVIVNEVLKNADGADRIEDKTDLTDIVNVKGDETYTDNGNGSLTWNAEGSAITYQGKTDEEIPVEMKVTYYLDGEEIDPSDLAGKSGHIRIRFDYTNKAKEGDVSVPFTVISGMVLDDNFSDIQVTNGKVLSDGTRNVVVGVAMPGLKDSLGVSSSDFGDKLEIPEYIEVEADVTDFSLSMTMSVISGNFMSEHNLDNDLDLTDIEDSVNALGEAADQLVSGSQDLSDGASKLQDGVRSYTDAVSQLQNGISSYTDGVSQVAEGTAALADKSGSLASGVSELASGAASVQSNYETLKEGAASLAAGVSQLDSTLKAGVTDEEKASAQAQVDAQYPTEETTAAARAQIEDQLTNGTETTTSLKNGMDSLVSGAVSASVNQSVYASVYASLKQATHDSVYAAMLKVYMAAGQPEETAAALAENDASAAVSAQDETFQASAQAAASEAAGQASAAVLSDANVTAGETQIISGVAQAMASSLVSQVKSAAVQGAVSGIASAKSAVDSGIQGLVSGAADLKAGADRLYAEGIQPLSAGIGTLSAGLPELMQGINSLNSGASTLNSKSSDLTGGASRITASNSELNSGASDLSDGAKKLAEGMLTFDEEGIEKITQLFNGDVRDLMEKIDDVMDAGAAYQSFAGKTDEMKGSTKFIIRTESIE